MNRSAMIPRSEPHRQPSDWRQVMQGAVRDSDELLRLVGLETRSAGQATKAFPVRVPRRFVRNMNHGDANDPLLLQVLPPGRSFPTTWNADPVGDRAARSGRGVIHKYHGRVLLVGTGACAIHCRYCFRQHFPYHEELAPRDDWADAIAYLERTPNVSEVILSGGDPLLLSTEKLSSLTRRLSRIPHLRRLRIHTRLPLVLPERFDDELLEWLDDGRWQTVLVMHANHANEMDDDGRAALARCRDAGVTLLNQSVLLAGVNDNASAQVGLAERLFDAGVLPYYLHWLDRVEGAQAFEVSRAAATELMEQLRRELPGYLVPRLVREKAGAPYKLPLF